MRIICDICKKTPLLGVVVNIDDICEVWANSDPTFYRSLKSAVRLEIARRTDKIFAVGSKVRDEGKRGLVCLFYCKDNSIHRLDTINHPALKEILAEVHELYYEIASQARDYLLAGIEERDIYTAKINYRNCIDCTISQQEAHSELAAPLEKSLREFKEAGCPGNRFDIWHRSLPEITPSVDEQS